MDAYIPPVSPNIEFRFRGVPFTPPVSPNIEVVFGVDDEGSTVEGMRQSNFLIFLSM